MDQKHALRVAVKLTAAREMQGWSMSELARRSGVNKHTIWAIEQGQVLDTRPRTLSVLCTALGVPTCDIFFAAGWLDKWELPSLENYLRSKYRTLPLGARRKMYTACSDIAKEYDVAFDDINTPLRRAVGRRRKTDISVTEMEENTSNNASNA